MLRMSRPGKKITRHVLKSISFVVVLIIHIRKTINMTNKMNELSLKEKACKSLLANVLDMDDDLRSNNLIYNLIVKIKLLLLNQPNLKG